jgi:hypothetical protein
MTKSAAPCPRCNRKSDCLILQRASYLAVKGCQYYIPKPSEHRRLMSEAIGRILDRKEFVHHINCDHSDNRLDNLFLCSPKEHVRIHCMMKKGKRRADAIRIILRSRERRIHRPERG